jgi:uncharacterized protein (TIGR02284 family)
MSKEKNEIFDEIEEILEKNEDARKGYEKASENTDDSALSSYFSKKASDREKFNSKLKAELKTVYADYDEDGSFKGSIHRAWMDVKSLFSADNDASMLEESIRGDKAAIEEYNDVIEYKNLPTGLRNLLVSQKNKIQNDINTHDSMESFK